MATNVEKNRLAAIRLRTADASKDWQLGKVGLELLAVVAPGTQPVVIADLAPDCGSVDRDFLLHAYDDIQFLLALLKRAAEQVRKWKPVELQQQDEAHASGNYAAECAMRCNDQAFRQFLLEKKAAPDISDAIRVESHVRYLLKVDSRGEINNSAEARKRWFDLRAEFNAWMRDAA